MDAQKGAAADALPRLSPCIVCVGANVVNVLICRLGLPICRLDAVTRDLQIGWQGVPVCRFFNPCARMTAICTLALGDVVTLAYAIREIFE